MAGIKSNVAMIYESRSSKSGMIEIKVQGWTYNPDSKGYYVRVADYAVVTSEVTTYDTTTGEPTVNTVESRQFIAQKEVYYKGEEIDALFAELGNSIDISESFTSELDGLISQALLIVTKQEPVYIVNQDGALRFAAPEDWVLNN